MNRQPTLSTKNIIIAVSAGTTMCMACAFVGITLREEAEIVGRIGLWSILPIALFFVCMLGRMVWERVLTLRANRRKAENEADARIVTVPEGHQVYAYSPNRKASWQPLHLDARRYINGRATDPLEFETQAWFVNQQLRRGATKIIEPTALLSEPSLDLLTVFSQPMQAYATIGGQQTGKTYQNQHIASQWVQRGATPYVVAPKWDVGEWPGCKLLGGNTDWGKVESGMALIQQRARERHESDLPHKAHPLQPVFLDDWTTAVNQIKSATDLILEATTLYASVNMILYFIIHSDTADAWGVSRKGAALKDNFVKLFILSQRDLNGLLNFGQSKGEIIFPGEKEGHPVNLINSPIVPSPIMIEANTERPKPTEREAKILELFNNRDNLSYRQMTGQIWGDHGGPRNKEIQQVWEKFGLI